MPRMETPPTPIKDEVDPVAPVAAAADPEAPPASSPPQPGLSDDNAAAMPTWRRWVILAVVCWMSLPMTLMSTSIMVATPEIARDLGTAPTAISTINAYVFLAMAASPLIWQPLAVFLGRRTTYLAGAVVLALGSLGCALANGTPALTAMWVLSGTTGPLFLVFGQTILSDIFEPTVRGTAVGFFLGSSVSAQSIAPLIGSVIATFSTWRVIFGVQGVMTVAGFALAFAFVPRARDLAGTAQAPTKPWTLANVRAAVNPLIVLRFFSYPGILLGNVSCGLLAMNQYGILSSVRHIINPRFGFDSPLTGGLFYLAPGLGFLIGSLSGGRISDAVVKRWIVRRGGARLPEDRLKATLPMIFGILPLGTLLYGWSVDHKIGGLGLPISAAFIQGFGLMASFSGLNTYAAESYPEFKQAVIGSKYIAQYLFGAASVASTIRIIDSVGVGWAFSISAFECIFGGVLVSIITFMLVRKPGGTPRTFCS